MTGRAVDRHGHRPGMPGAGAGPGGPRRGTPAWRSLVTGARLGWAIESNWTDPFLFAVYAVARPVGAALVLVAIVWLVGGGSRPDYVGIPRRRQRLLDVRRRGDVGAGLGGPR